jgi:hypothetical protein
MAEQKINRNYLVIGGLAVATILALVVIRVVGPGDSDPAANAPIVEELNQEILELESSILELELVYTEKDQELDQMLEMVDQKNDRLTALEKKIEQLEEEGEVSQEVIDRLRAKLERARRAAESQTRVNTLVRDQSNLTRLLDSLQGVVIKRDSLLEVAQVQLVNCAGEQAAERGLEAADVPPKLSILNFEVFAINKKGDKSQVIGKQIASEDLQELEFCVDVVGNGTFETGQVFLDLIVKSQAEGNLLKNRGGRVTSIMVNGRETVISNRLKFNYTQNKKIEDVCIPLVPMSNPSGTYIADIYHDNKKIFSKMLFFY